MSDEVDRKHADRYKIYIQVDCDVCDFHARYHIPYSMLTFSDGVASHAFKQAITAVWHGGCKESVAWEKIKKENAHHDR